MESAIFSVKESAKDVISSVVGAACCCFTGQPFDTIKVRMQSRAAEFHGVGQAFRRTVSREGTFALWKGWPATLTGMVMENAAAFGMNEQLKRLFPDSSDASDDRDYFKGVLLGGITGVFCGVALCPADNVKCRVQFIANALKPGERAPSARDVAVRIWHQQGFRGFFQGLDAQMMRDGPFYMIFFGGYEVSVLTIKSVLPSLPDEVVFFVSGGLAGMAGWGAVMPADGPKSIIQASWNRSAWGHFTPVMAEVYGARGLQGLYAGFGPAMLRAFPANAALFLGYEMTRSALK